MRSRSSLPDRHQRLREPEAPLHPYLRPGEERTHLGLGDELAGRDLLDGFTVRAGTDVTQMPVPRDEYPRIEGKELHPREQPVRLDREVAVRRLHPVAGGASQSTARAKSLRR